MAVNPSAKSNYLSKVKIGEAVYWVKDAELREILNSAATKTAIETIITAGEGINNNHDTIPTTKALVDWLEAQIQGLTGAMHFAGVTDPESGDTFEERVADLYGSNTPEAGDLVIDGTKEYVYDGTSWKELGDEGLYVTKPELETALQNLSVAGVAMGADKAITKEELITALGLKSLAFKDEASGTVVVPTASQTLTGVAKADTYNLTGTAVEVPQTFTSLDVTPAGNVTLTSDTAAAVAYDKATTASYQKVSEVAVTSAAAGEGTPNYTPAGNVTLPSFTGAFTAQTTTVATVTDPGTAFTLSDGAVTQGTDTTSPFTTEGVTAAMDTTDTEMLVFTAAATSNAVTASGTINYTKQTISGALPTFGQANVATGGTVAVTADGDASFTGTGAIISATPNFEAASAAVATESATATVTQPVFSATFTGTSKTVTPVAATTATAAPSDATVTVASEDKAITLATETKNVTVS